MQDPYKICPTFETETFILRLVSEEDSEELLKCYSDNKAQKIFNSDRCTGDFCIYTIEDMLQCIRAWLYAYSQQEFIRFAIIDKSLSKAIGTVEMFGYVGKCKTKTGILRVDVSSEYEIENNLNEIFSVCNENFFDLFEVDIIATKAIPQAVERRQTLLKMDFSEGKVYEGEHYYLRSK
jgi:hypothetical protein